MEQYFHVKFDTRECGMGWEMFWYDVSACWICNINWHEREN